MIEITNENLFGEIVRESLAIAEQNSQNVWTRERWKKAIERPQTRSFQNRLMPILKNRPVYWS